MKSSRSLWIVVLLAGVLTATCQSRRPAFEEADDSSPPLRGGTLKIVGSSDVDHLSTTSAYGVVSFGLLWTFTRQLVTYPLSKDFEQSTHVAADLAEAVPTIENGGISADSRTYTFHLRRGVRWNTTPPREVTAQDVVRGVKMICNPHSARFRNSGFTLLSRAGFDGSGSTRIDCGRTSVPSFSVLSEFWAALTELIALSTLITLIVPSLWLVM